MSFLAPTSAMVAAALVLPALLVMYLLKLRRRPLRVSSVLLWPEALNDVQVNVPLAPPRPSVLMLLHVLIALALIVAVGRPVLLGAGGSAERTILVIDRSASMSALDGAAPNGERVSRFEEARRRAREIVDRGSASAQFAVISLAANAEIVKEFGADAAGVRAAIDQLTPTDQPGDLGAALQVARSLLAGTGDSDGGSGAGAADVLVLSDGSFAESAADIIAPGGAVRLIRCGPTPATEKPNLGVVVFSGRRDAERPDVVHLFAKVQNSGAAARVVPIRLAVNGSVLETRSIEVPGTGNDGPGEQAAVLSANAPGGGLATVSVLVDDDRDLLASDNTVATLLKSAAPVRILLVQRAPGPRQDGEPGASISADFLLADALLEIAPQSVTVISSGRYEEAVRAGELKFFDLVVFDGVSPREAPALPSISFGAGVPGLELGDEAKAESERPHPVISWVRANPILRDVTLDGVVIARERAVQDRRATVLARSEFGPVIVLTGGPALGAAQGAVQEGGQAEISDSPGRLVVTFALENSNWPLQAGFPIFLKSAIDVLTSRGSDAAGTQFRTVQPVTVAGSGAAPVYTGPIRVESRPVSGGDADSASGAAGRFTLGVLDRAGVYFPPEGSGFPPVAVNLLDAHESAVATSDVLRIGTRRIADSGNTARPREVWWWALVAAAFLLALEWLVFARSARL